MKGEKFEIHYFLNKCARSYRLRHVVIMGIGLLIFFGFWIWSEYERAEEMRRSIIINCIFSCQRGKAEKIGDEAFGPSIMAECYNFCRKKHDPEK